MEAQLIVHMFDSEETGQGLLAKIRTIQKEQIIRAAIEALAVKYQKGKVKPTRTVEKLRTLSVDICFEPLRQGRMKQAS